MRRLRLIALWSGKNAWEKVGNCVLKSLEFLPPNALPETNQVPLKIGRAPKGNVIFQPSNHQFSGVNLLLFSEHVLLTLDSLEVNHFYNMIPWFRVLEIHTTHIICVEWHWSAESFAIKDVQSLNFDIAPWECPLGRGNTPLILGFHVNFRGLQSLCWSGFGLFSLLKCAEVLASHSLHFKGMGLFFRAWHVIVATQPATSSTCRW